MIAVVNNKSNSLTNTPEKKARMRNRVRLVEKEVKKLQAKIQQLTDGQLHSDLVTIMKKIQSMLMRFTLREVLEICFG